MSVSDNSANAQDQVDGGEAVPLIRAVLFDMGGVLVELGSLDELLGLSVDAGREFWESWLTSDAVRKYERGLTDTATFADHLVEEFQLTLSADEFIERFRQFPRGLFPGAVELVAGLPNGLITGILSNTNELHWENQTSAEVIKNLCQRSYLSYELHMVKPDLDVFEHIVADLDLPADQILFIDDNQINVDGARQAGLHAQVAQGVAEASNVLSQYRMHHDV